MLQNHVAESRPAAMQEQLQGQSTPPQVQESAEASVSCTAVVQPSQPAGTNAPGATAARQGAEAEAVEGMPFSVGVKMAQLCIAGDPLFSEGLLTSPALKVSPALCGCSVCQLSMREGSQHDHPPGNLTVLCGVSLGSCGHPRSSF